MFNPSHSSPGLQMSSFNSAPDGLRQFLRELREASAHIYESAYVSDPETRRDRSPCQVGDEYFNALDNLCRRWNGAGWIASDLNTANLAHAAGASLVGYDGGTVQDVLDVIKPLQSYDALRTYTGRALNVRITGDGIAGDFERDDADERTGDNGGAAIVDGMGRRWRRVFDGEINVRWFGARADGVTDDTLEIQVALDLAAAAGKFVRIPGHGYRIGSLKIGNTRLIGDSMNVYGDKCTLVSTSVGVAYAVALDGGSLENISVRCDAGNGIDAAYVTKKTALKDVYVHSGTVVPGSIGVSFESDSAQGRQDISCTHIGVRVRNFDTCFYMRYFSNCNVYIDFYALNTTKDEAHQSNYGFRISAEEART
jgi:hypothetical protein